MDIQTISQIVLAPINSVWDSFVMHLPGLVGALALLIIGYIVGHIVGVVLTKILNTLKVDEWTKKLSKPNLLAGITISKLSGELAKWWIFIAFLSNAASLVKLSTISTLLTNLAVWAPHLIVAVIIMAIGLVVADYVAAEISKAKRFKYSNALSTGVKAFITAFFAIYALGEIGLNIVLAETTLLLLVAGVVFALSLGFGLGLKKHAEEIIGEVRKEIK